MSEIYPAIDPDGLFEYSVVFSDRSLNHMSVAFQTVMREISQTLRSVYRASEVALIPGGGTIGMEAIARQFACDQRCLVLRNGWFSYRWSQIFDVGDIPSAHEALLARPTSGQPQAPFAPAPLEEVLTKIREWKPEVVFATHVETAAGIMLPDGYMKAVAAEIHKLGGLFILDCVASGAAWVDMQEIGVDVLLSAPQKSWSASPCAALVMLSETAVKAMKSNPPAKSFALDLARWREIMRAYEDGGHAYHATLPTDALVRFHAAMIEMKGIGFEELRNRQFELGRRVRELLIENDYSSVAAEGFEAPGVVVTYTQRDRVHKGTSFAERGVQIAAGVPLACKEPADFMSFRIGLFGIDKLMNIERTLNHLEEALPPG